MTSREMVRDIVDLQRTVSKLNDEIPDAGITLTRTAIQAITTAGTALVWQSRIRGQGMTWSGANVTVPSDGWYAISLTLQTSVSLNDLYVALLRNGLNTVQASTIGDVDRNRISISFVRYFLRSDTISLSVFPSANVNVVVNAEGGAGESPILHIVQLSTQAEV